MQVKVFPFVCVMGTVPCYYWRPSTHCFGALCASSSPHQWALCSAMKDTCMPAVHSPCNPSCSAQSCSLLSAGCKATLSLCLFHSSLCWDPEFLYRQETRVAIGSYIAFDFSNLRDFQYLKTLSHTFFCPLAVKEGGHTRLLLFYLFLTKVHTYLYLWLKIKPWGLSWNKLGPSTKYPWAISEADVII